MPGVLRKNVFTLDYFRIDDAQTNKTNFAIYIYSDQQLPPHKLSNVFAHAFARHMVVHLVMKLSC